MNNEAAVVIGVGGMGAAIARRLGSGRALLIADADRQVLDTVADRLRGEGHQVRAQRVDVSDDRQVAELARAAAGIGRVTRLAHTAGLSPTQATTEAILRVDLLGVALVLDAFETVIAAGGAGVVVASMSAHMAPLPDDHEQALATTPTDSLLSLPFLGADAVTEPAFAYMIAKRANILRVRAAAAGWGRRGARINSLSPGVISTPMGNEELAGESGDGMRQMVADSPTGRLGTPDDIASTAAFLLDPAAAYITGTDLLVDGGVVASALHPPQA